MADSRVLHCVESVAAAKEILRANHCSVGLVVFDSPEPAFREEIEQLISATPTTEWIAIVTRTTIGYKALHAFILNAFHDFHTLPVDPQRLAMTIGHACGRAGLRLALAAPDNASGRFGILGASPAMTDFFRKLEKVVDADLPVLIGGESGTGKELVAKAMHGHSSRSQRPFVVVNCAAIPANLIQAELFGYEKGAFTGATERKIGKIEAANGGLLFLDEIGDLPLELQGTVPPLRTATVLAGQPLHLAGTLRAAGTLPAFVIHMSWIGDTDRAASPVNQRFRPPGELPRRAVSPSLQATPGSANPCSGVTGATENRFVA